MEIIVIKCGLHFQTDLYRDVKIPWKNIETESRNKVQITYIILDIIYYSNELKVSPFAGLVFLFS